MGWRRFLTGFLPKLVGPTALLLFVPSFVRADAPWRASERVNDAPSVVNSSGFSIATDGIGNAYALWVDGREPVPSDSRVIYSSYRPAGGSWRASERVSDTTGQFSPCCASHSSIAVDPAGNANAVWADRRVGNWDIYFSYRPAGGSWSPNVRVNDDVTSQSQETPAIAVDANGNAYAVWSDSRNVAAGWDIYFSYRPVGGSWSANERVNDVEARSQYWPSIAVDAAGNAYAVWQDERNIHSDIYFAYRPAGGSWQANVRVNDDTSNAHQHFPSIAVDASGNAYAVWQDERRGNRDIYFSYRPAGGSWGPNERVNDDVGTARQEYPVIAVDPSGNAWAVWMDWRDWDQNGIDVYSAYRPPGGSWGTNVRVNETGPAYRENRALAVDTSGKAYALWPDGSWNLLFSYRSLFRVFFPLALKEYPGGW